MDDNSKTQDQPKILIIDDDPMYTIIIEAMLESEPYHVTSIDDGKEALEHLKSSLPNVILLDYMMPVPVWWRIHPAHSKNAQDKIKVYFWNNVLSCNAPFVYQANLSLPAPV